MAVIKVDDSLKNKIEYEAKENNKTLKNMTDEIIEFYFDSKEREINSTVQQLLETQFNKMDKHLASMLARNNIDTAMVLVSNFLLIEKLTDGEMKFDEMQKFMREQAVKYLSKARKEDKKNG